MNKETAEEIQCSFEYLALDGYCPVFFTPQGSKCKKWQWQFAVEFIYRLLVCKLAILEPIKFNTKKELSTYCHKLAIQNPFSMGNNESWYSGEIVLTKKGLDLVKQYIPYVFEYGDVPFKLNNPFILTIESIFSDYEVPWEENNPLFPIQSII